MDQNNYQHPAGNRLSIVITKDKDQKSAISMEIVDEDSNRVEVIHFSDLMGNGDDAIAPNTFAGMPLFCSSPRENESAPTEDDGDTSPTLPALPPMDVKTLMNISDSDDDEEDDNNPKPPKLPAPNVLSPTSQVISQAMQRFSFSPTSQPPPRHNRPPMVPPVPPMPDIDPSTPKHQTYTVEDDFYADTPDAPVTPIIRRSNNPDDLVYRNTPSLSVYLPPNDRPAADLASIGELTVFEGNNEHIHGVKRTAHVRFDPETGQYTGVPEEWSSEIKKTFGLPLQLCSTLTVPGYSARLPPVLIQMKDYLVKNGGLLQRGIFRLAPEGNEAAMVKNELNNGTFKSCSDVNVIANLLKVWHRDMPLRLFDHIRDPNRILNCETKEQAGNAVLTVFTDPHRSLLLWLLDLCADVCEQSEVNMMVPQNMAIVFAPNLFKLDDGPSSGMDPIKLMSVCKKYTTFLEKAIEWRMGQTDRPKCG